MDTNRRFCLALALIVVLQFYLAPSYSQVYNYLFPDISNIEINPAALASTKFESRLTAAHLNSMSGSRQFQHSSIRYSKYLSRLFSGVGLSINRTDYGNSSQYYHAGLGLGYRNVLFNSVFVRIGAMYKWNQIAAPPGNFEYLELRGPGGETVEQTRHSVNGSIMFSNEETSRYISISYLNYPLGSTTGVPHHFPRYLVWNVGNLLSFDGIDHETRLIYTGFIKTLDAVEVSHYLTIQKRLVISRSTSLLLASRAGTTVNEFYHLAPILTLYQRRWSLQALYNIHIGGTGDLPQTAQITFTCKP